VFHGTSRPWLDQLGPPDRRQERGGFNWVEYIAAADVRPFVWLAEYMAA